MPFPLPAEMKVDENGKELDVEALLIKYTEYNEGKKDILQFDPNGEIFGAVILAAGWRPYEAKEGEFAHLGWGRSPDVVTNHQFEANCRQRKNCPTVRRQRSQIRCFYSEPGQGEMMLILPTPALLPAWWL